jgi:hypothetical protein
MDRRKDLEQPVQPSYAHGLVHYRRCRGQAQGPPEQPGAPFGAHEDGQAAGVDVSHQ